jgi:hypothetical protein
MVSTGYHDTGEEWAQKNAFRQDLITRDTTVEVLLYDDSTDALTDASDIGDITTEPTDGNYTRQTVTLDSTDVSLSVSGGDLRAEAQVTFDVTDTTGTVDATATVVDLQSDVVNAEGAQNPHLLYSATLDIGSIDLTDFTGVNATIRLNQD